VFEMVSLQPLTRTRTLPTVADLPATLALAEPKPVLGKAVAPPTTARARPTRLLNDIPLARERFDAFRPWDSLVGRPADATLDALKRALSEGRQSRSIFARTKISGGVNGRIPVATYIDELTRAKHKAVVKSISAGGAQERFASQVGRAMHIEHLVPIVGRRADGSSAMQFFRGSTLRYAGILSADNLERALRVNHAILDPAASAAVVARRARIDRQLVQVFDYLLANGDRHGSNAMLDARRGAVALIDNGLIDRYDPRAGRTPIVRHNFQSSHDTYSAGKGVSKTPLDDQVVALLRHTDRGRIRAAFAQMLEDQAGASSVGGHARASSPEYLGQIMARLDAAIRDRAIRTIQR